MAIDILALRRKRLEHISSRMRLRGEGFDASEDGTGRGTPIVPVAFAENQRNEIREMQVAGALSGIRRGDAKNERF